MDFSTTVHALQLTLCTSLIFIGGLSSCLSLWVIPLTSLLPPKLLARQFQQTFTWGEQYLLPSSRTLGGLTLLTTILTSRLPDPDKAVTWTTWAWLFVALVVIAPYEIYCIFPINDRVKEIGRELESGVRTEDDVKGELRGLLGRWRVRNWGRILGPAAVGVLGLVYGWK